MTPLPIINSAADLAALPPDQQARHAALVAGAKTVRLARLDKDGNLAAELYDEPAKADGATLIVVPPAPPHNPETHTATFTGRAGWVVSEKPEAAEARAKAEAAAAELAKLADAAGKTPKDLGEISTRLQAVEKALAERLR